jgi:heptosyltransferase-1
MLSGVGATAPRRALIVKLSSLGDVIHTAPVLVDLARAFPGVEIDWVVEEAFVPLVGCMEGVTRIIPIALRRWRRAPARSREEMRRCWHELRDIEYDAVLDLQGLVKSGLVSRIARGPRYGLGNRTDGASYEPLARLAYDRAIELPPRIHVVDRSRELASRALGYPLEGQPVVPWRVPPLHPHDDRWADPDAVLLVHGSAKAVKTLGPRFWIDLGHELVKEGRRTWLPWGTDEEHARAQHIAQAIGQGAAVLPRLPLDRLAAVIAASGGAIGLDTGLSHMSATLGRPTVQIFIEAKAWRAGVYWEPRTRVLQTSEEEPADIAQTLQAWREVT